MDKPKITIIIPTRERADVLFSALRTVIDQDYDRLEIIISDNLSGDATRDIVESFSDPRIRYINPGRRLSMSHNWEFALSHVSEGWVSFLGDDDGLMSNALSKLTNLISETNALAVRSSLCSYRWPDVAAMGQSRLSVPLRKGFEVRSSSEWLDRVLRGISFYTNLPVIYQSGFVHYSVIDRIRSRSGHFFRSSIPDVYSGVAIATEIPSYVYSHEPLAVNAASSHSNGRAALKAGASINGASRKFIEEGNIPFHADVPLAPDGMLPSAVGALVYETYLQSRDVFGKANLYTPEDQLRVVLRTTPDLDAIEGWIKSFAAKHNLDVGQKLRSGRIFKMKSRVRDIARIVNEELTTARVWNFTAEPDDVFMASNLASQLVVEPPSVIDRFGKLARRLITRSIVSV